MWYRVAEPCFSVVCCFIVSFEWQFLVKSGLLTYMNCSHGFDKKLRKTWDVIVFACVFYIVLVVMLLF